VLLTLAPLLLGAGGGGSDTARLLLALAAMLVSAKLLGEVAERLGQPAVLGELVAGVLLGGSVLGVVPTEGPPGELIHLLSELGLLLLLFEIGLEIDLRGLFHVGPASLAVAVVGVAVPFALAYVFWAHVYPAPPTGFDRGVVAILLGATLTATSVGITARVLSDLGCMNSAEARIIIGAAVIDDVLGLVILTVVSGIANGTAVSVSGTLWTLAVAVGFLVIAVLLGRFIMPRLFDLVVRMRVRFVLLVFSVAFAVGLSALASAAGSALIIGAFAAGIILSGTNQFDTIEHEVKPVASVFTPIFFVSVGASLNVALLNPATPEARSILALAGLITLLAIAGKVVAGWAAPWLNFRRLVVGVGMVPRGEVGLIFADMGRRSGLLTSEVFGAVLIMIMATTFVTPPVLKSLIGPGRST
jgi:Kef-type K+ transport system membrane component KefB